MVRFRLCKTKKRYKKKDYPSKHYSMNYPTELNEKIEPHCKKDFEIESFIHTKKPKREYLNITLARDIDETEQP